ncbi:MAG: DUF3794 domain-containing protein [Clostridiales bacterium]|nr:DUF3794 domain-containing protein [Clostridiales bacterium]
MTIEYEKKLLKVDQPLEEVVFQHLAEGELVIPEGKPDIAKILDLATFAYVTGKEVVQDKVMVEGIIRYNLLYIAVGDNSSVVQAEDEMGFTLYVDIEGAKPRMIAQVSLELEHIDWHIENSRTLNLKAVLNIGCKVRQLLQLEVIKDFVDQEAVQALMEPIKLTASGGIGSSQTIIREDVEIPDDMPSATSVLRKEANARVLEKKVIDNRIIIQGEADLKILYETDEPQDPIQLLQYQIPFAHFVEVQGAYQGMDCDARALTQELDISMRQDVVGDTRVLAIDMILFLEGEVFEFYEGDIVVDAYSPGLKLDLKREKIKQIYQAGKDQAQSIIKENIEIGENMPPVANVLYSDAKPLVTDYHISQGQVIVDGALTGLVFYKPEDEGLPVNSVQVDIPFTQTIEIEGISEDMDCTCNATVLYISHTQVSPTEIELKVTLLVQVEAEAIREKEVLLDVEVVEGDQREDSGVYIYFVQPGDSLWSVAKKYNTTISSILKFNDLEDTDSLEAGSKLMVFKRLDFSVS